MTAVTAESLDKLGIDFIYSPRLSDETLACFSILSLSVLTNLVSTFF